MTKWMKRSVRRLTGVTLLMLPAGFDRAMSTPGVLEACIKPGNGDMRLVDSSTPVTTTNPESHGILPGRRDLRDQQDRLDQPDHGRNRTNRTRGTDGCNRPGGTSRTSRTVIGWGAVCLVMFAGALPEFGWRTTSGSLRLQWKRVDGERGSQYPG
jgi:hypothetical protein